MADSLVIEWMEEYSALTESETHTYAMEQEHNQEIMSALYVIFEDPSAFSGGYQLVGRICQQLLEFYRTGERQLQKFSMQYVPSLILLHLLDRNAYPAIKTLLVSLYNLEVVDVKNQPKVKSFRVPSLAQSSIYHDFTTLEPAFKSQSSLKRFEECNTKLVSWGPLPQVESFNAQNRQRVLSALIFLYNQQLASVSVQGLEFACRAISRMVTKGFVTNAGSRNSSDSGSSQASVSPRLIISRSLLLELLQTVRHSIERGVHGAGQTLQDISNRATYEIYTDVLLAANAVQNSLKSTASSSLTSRPSNKQTVSKSMITNASFRTKKLPDDIPIQQQEGEPGSLDSIVEEQEGGEGKIKFRGRSGSALKHLPKLPGLSKKPKVKNSPTPPRHGSENEQGMELRMGGGDQHGLSAIDGLQQGEQPQIVHISTV